MLWKVIRKGKSLILYQADDNGSKSLMIKVNTGKDIARFKLTLAEVAELKEILQTFLELKIRHKIVFGEPYAKKEDKAVGNKEKA